MSAITTASRSSSADHLALWQEYRASGDRALRDRLVLTFAPMVKYVVFRKVRELPARCEAEDFIACGLEALIQALDRFDPSHGAPLEHYLWTRVHGAVLDELRRQDWAPRSVRRWERDVHKAVEEFTLLHRRAPTRAELAAALGVEESELHRREQEIARSETTSLNGIVATAEDPNIERIDTVAALEDDTDPERWAAAAEAKRRFRQAFARLPRREREVAVLLYVRNLTLAEVGDILGVSESRICQLHRQLKRVLRDELEGDAPLFEAVA